MKKCASVLLDEEPVVIPTPVLGEVGYFAETRTSPAVEADFLRRLARGEFDVASPELADYARAPTLSSGMRTSRWGPSMRSSPPWPSGST